MNILLTNDDGIDSQGLYTIYKELKKIGNVTVVAPATERSAVSHAITLSEPIFSKEHYKNGKFFGTSISGTPADCIKFALAVIFKKKPDVIVSGINLGPNEGCSVFYSGTVAAAREGALSGIPSIAVSLSTFVDPYFNYAAKLGAEYVKIVLNGNFPKNSFLNINVPNKKRSKIKGIKITKQCREAIHGIFQEGIDPNNRKYHWLCGRAPSAKKDLYFDTYALNKGYITVTPISTDTTDYKYIEKLKINKK